MNVGQVRTNGVDVDVRTRWSLGPAGRMSAQLQWSRMLRYTIDREGQRYELAGTHGPRFVSTNTGPPRARMSLPRGRSRGPGELPAIVQRIGSFAVTDPSTT